MWNTNTQTHKTDFHTHTHIFSHTHIQTLSLSLSLTHTFIKCSQIFKENIEGQLFKFSWPRPGSFYKKFHRISDPWTISFRSSHKSPQSVNSLKTRSGDRRTDGQSADNSFYFPKENALKTDQKNLNGRLQVSNLDPRFLTVFFIP